jgi:hypothetical protein
MQHGHDLDQALERRAALRLCFDHRWRRQACGIGALLTFFGTDLFSTFAIVSFDLIREGGKGKRICEGREKPGLSRSSEELGAQRVRREAK